MEDEAIVAVLSEEITVTASPGSPRHRVPNLLSIAGSDPSGGAGIQADLKTFAALGCYGMAVLTALTAQNTRGVTAVHIPPADFLAAQLDTVFADVDVAAIKIGMLATGEITEVVARCLRERSSCPSVLDPVLVATSGDSLGAPDVVAAMRRHLMPLASVITPNLPEAARLAESEIPADVAGMSRLAETLCLMGAKAALVKGGHLSGSESVDVLFDGVAHHVFGQARVSTSNTHGTGCTLSSAIAAFLAKGLGLVDAIASAKSYLSEALRQSGKLTVGGGHGPVHHFHALWPNGPQKEP